MMKLSHRFAGVFATGACVVLTATALRADPVADAVSRAVTDHALPAVGAFAAQTQALDIAARADCTPAALRPAYHAAFDAWMRLQHLNIGPLEEGGRYLTVAFWPDKKGMTPRSIEQMVAAQDPAAFDPDHYSEVSIAARGLFALEYMLFDAAQSDYDRSDYACALVQAMSHDLARTGAEISDGWTGGEANDGGFAQVVLTAGEEGNTRYLSKNEALQQLYTMLTTGLENTVEQRIDRPMGTFDRPRPTRAEAYRSERSLRNIELSVVATRDLARALAPAPMPDTEAVFAEVIAKAEALDDPALAGVTDPMSRFKIEILAQRIDALQGMIANDIGAPLGVSAGFNASDGD